MLVRVLETLVETFTGRPCRFYWARRRPRVVLWGANLRRGDVQPKIRPEFPMLELTVQQKAVWPSLSDLQAQLQRQWNRVHPSGPRYWYWP